MYEHHMVIIVKADNYNDAIEEAEYLIDELMDIGMLHSDISDAEIDEKVGPIICGKDNPEEFITVLTEARQRNIDYVNLNLNNADHWMVRHEIKSLHSSVIDVGTPARNWVALGHVLHRIGAAMCRHFYKQCKVYHADEHTSGVTAAELINFEMDPSKWSLVHITIR